MMLYNKSKEQSICGQLEIAESFFTRFKGLMLKKDLNRDSGLLIKPCNSIHTFFMLTPIDILFIDHNWEVKYLIKNFRPWRVSPLVKKGKMVIELPSGTISDKNITLGDILWIGE